MEAQLERLIELVGEPNIALYVVPLHSGYHGAAAGSFSILRFAAPELPDVVYVEQLTSALYLDKRRDVDPLLRGHGPALRAGRVPGAHHGAAGRILDRMTGR